MVIIIVGKLGSKLEHIPDALQSKIKGIKDNINSNPCVYIYASHYKSYVNKESKNSLA